MSITLAVLIFAFAAVFLVSTYSKSIEPSTFRNFSVTGEGKAVGMPDIAEFFFSVITEGGKQVSDLQKDNTQKMNRILEFIKSNDVDSKDIKTANYNLTPRYRDYVCEAGRFGGRVCPPPTIVGYTINQTVSVKVRDFEKIGALLSGAVQNGANSVSELVFRIDDPTEIENLARQEAINKAKRKAKSIADAGGFGLGRLLSIEENPTYPFGKGGYEAMPVMAIDQAPAPMPPSIEPGSQEINVNIVLRYEID